jgi:hypothetical protein
MVRNTFISAFIGAALVGAIAVGCDSEDTKTYGVDVYWQIAGADVCSANPGIGGVGELTFDTVRISVLETEDATTTLQTADVSCEDHAYTIEGLARGTYWVRVDALATVEGDTEELPYYQAAQTITVPSGTEDPNGYKFALEVGKATVEVRWDFAAAGMICQDYDVEEIDISIANEIVPCNDPENGTMYVVRDVSWNSYTITIDGLNADGDPVVHGEYNDGDSFEIKPKEYVGGDAIVVILEEI